MNRKSKIIISIVGITIVALALLGITYAYYLTRIEGNTNTNSISLTTAKLELVYGDNRTEIITSNAALIPDSNNPIGTKTFTVTNNGNDSEYVVVIDNVSITKVSDNSDTTFVSNDFRYTLTCIVKDKSGNTLTNEKCNQVESLSIFPIKGGILVGNDIKEKRVHEYTLTMWYIDTGVDQSDDMGKTYQARVNINDISNINPYSDNENSLACKIINNSKNETNGTKLVVTPRTPITENADASVQLKYVQDNYKGTTFPNVTYYYENMTFDENTGMTALSNRKVATTNEDYVGNYVDYCSCNNQDPCSCPDSFYVESVDGDTFTTISLWPEFTSYNELENNEKELSIALDDFGISYYYRGRVLDNYVNYANKCWRIVRILGNGSIKLVLEDNGALCNSNDYTGTFSIGNSTLGTVYNEIVGKEILSYMDLSVKDSYSTTSLMYKNYQTNTGEFSITGIKDYTSVLTNKGWCIEEEPYTYEGKKLKDLTDEEYEAWVESETYDGIYYPVVSYAPSFRRQNNLYTFKCDGLYVDKFDSNTNMLVGALTMDETVYSGIVASTYPNRANSSYLFNKFGSEYDSIGEQYIGANSMSLGNTTSQEDIYMATNLDGVYPMAIQYSAIITRPVVILNPNIEVTGTGTKSDPYVIEVE